MDNSRHKCEGLVTPANMLQPKNDFPFATPDSGFQLTCVTYVDGLKICIHTGFFFSDTSGHNCPIKTCLFGG